MKRRYRLIRRGNRGGAFYCVDTQTGKRSSLGAITEDEACQIVEAKNTARRHGRIVAREQNPERRAFYQLAWHLGASQADLAGLESGTDGEGRGVPVA